MKNIHLLPTDKPSRLYLVKSNNKLDITSNNPEYTENFGSGTQNQHIYITSDEEIKEGIDQWYLDKVLNKPYNSGGAQYSSKQDVIILTTDVDLIKVGVQSIDDEFLEWFVKNQSCEEVEVSYEVLNPFQSIDKGYVLRLPDIANFLEEPKQELVNDLADLKANAKEDYMKVPISVLRYISELENQMCSDEEVFNLCREFAIFVTHKDPSYKQQQQWFEQFKKK